MLSILCHLSIIVVPVIVIILLYCLKFRHVKVALFRHRSLTALFHSGIILAKLPLLEIFAVWQCLNQSAGICSQIYNFVVNNDIRSKQIQEGECLAWVSSPVRTLVV